MRYYNQTGIAMHTLVGHVVEPHMAHKIYANTFYAFIGGLGWTPHLYLFILLTAIEQQCKNFRHSLFYVFLFDKYITDSN